MRIEFIHAEVLCERTLRKLAPEERPVEDERQCDAHAIVRRLVRKPMRPRVKH